MSTLVFKTYPICLTTNIYRLHFQSMAEKRPCVHKTRLLRRGNGLFSDRSYPGVTHSLFFSQQTFNMQCLLLSTLLRTVCTYQRLETTKDCGFSSGFLSPLISTFSHSYICHNRTLTHTLSPSLRVKPTLPWKSLLHWG